MGYIPPKITIARTHPLKNNRHGAIYHQEQQLRDSIPSKTTDIEPYPTKKNNRETPTPKITDMELYPTKKNNFETPSLLKQQEWSHIPPK